jgi:hypothetical protein
MLEKIDDIAYAIRKLRIVSITALVFNSYLLYNFLEWVMVSDPTLIGEAAAVTGVIGSLVALFRFIFQFATSNETDDKR